MRRSALRLYAPFIALALLQGALVAWAPSKGGEDQLFAQGGVAPGGAFGGTGAATGGSSAADAGVTAGGAPAGVAAGDPATGGTGTATGGSGGGSGGVAAGVAGAGAPTTGDTSHCTGDRQTDVIYNAPPCVPAWPEGADNGGATYPGVSGTEIELVLFECEPNEQVNAILATQGLAASQAQTDAMVDAAVRWMNATYEFYGRQLVWEHVIGDCPLTPPDPARSRQAAAEVARTQPAFVIHYAAGPETHDVWSQNRIVSLGAPNIDNSFYAGRRPYRWDIFTSGTEGARQVAEYYCKKLANGRATHAGQLIHPSIGGRNTPRKLAVIVPDNGNGASVPNGQTVQRLVNECSGQEVVMVTYASDINRAAEQTRATVATLISEKVTTVACMCDAIAPVFLTQGMTQNNYFPEHLLPGANLLDYDILGRLYDPPQWQHAFGPSQLVNPVPFEQSDAARIWRAAGNDGLPCASCNLITGYLVNIGSMIHMAGPNLNPLAIEAALVGNQYRRGGWAETGGDPGIYLIKYGPEDYNAISDYREVYWDPAARSAIDNRPGAYVPMNNGRRYATGELGTDFTVPAKPQ